jgi:hypothetical protein
MSEGSRIFSAASSGLRTGHVHGVVFLISTTDLPSRIMSKRELTHPSTGSQIAFARVATALALVSVGALAAGAVAVGSLAIRRLAVGEASLKKLRIEELEVERLRVKELIQDT